MAVTVIANEGSLTGTAPVTLLAAPAGATVRATPKDSVGVYNKDTVAHDFTFQKNKGGTITEVAKIAAVAPGGLAVMPKKVALDATNESLEAKSDATATTTEPTFDVIALEIT